MVLVLAPICSSGGALPNMQGAVGTPSSTDQLIDVRPHQDLSSALPIQRKEKEKTHSVFSVQPVSARALVICIILSHV